MTMYRFFPPTPRIEALARAAAAAESAYRKAHATMVEQRGLLQQAMRAASPVKVGTVIRTVGGSLHAGVEMLVREVRVESLIQGVRYAPCKVSRRNKDGEWSVRLEGLYGLDYEVVTHPPGSGTMATQPAEPSQVTTG